MTGNSFVAKDRSGFFYRRANVEVLGLRIVSWNEIEATRVFVIDARSIHETSGTSRLESFGKLANFKPAQVRWQRHEMIGFQKIDHLSFAAFVGFEESLLILRHVCAARRVRIGKRRIG